MEPNIDLKKYIIIIINNAKGNIQRLNTILQKISSQKNFDILILTGEVFSLSTKKEDILSISFKGEIIIFDSSPILINSYSTRHIVCNFSNTGLTVTTSYGENTNYALKIYYIYGIKYNGIVTVNNPNSGNSSNNSNNNLDNIDNYIPSEEILS